MSYKKYIVTNRYTDYSGKNYYIQREVLWPDNKRWKEIGRDVDQAITITNNNIGKCSCWILRKLNCIIWGGKCNLRDMCKRCIKEKRYSVVELEKIDNIFFKQQSKKRRKEQELHLKYIDNGGDYYNYKLFEEKKILSPTGKLMIIPEYKH